MAKTIPVLVVDDDAVSSAQLCALAKAAGYAPTAAANGREAWEMLQLSRFQVVISDWYMPEMDGLELCRRVRARRPALHLLHHGHIPRRQAAVPDWDGGRGG